MRHSLGRRPSRDGGSAAAGMAIATMVIEPPRREVAQHALATGCVFGVPRPSLPVELPRERAQQRFVVGAELAPARLVRVAREAVDRVPELGVAAPPRP